ILPGDQLAVGVQAALQGVETTGTEVVVLHVVFTGPLQLHRTTFHATRNGGRLIDEVVGQLATEAAADAGHVQHGIFRGHVSYDRSAAFTTLRDLRGRPDLDAAIFVQRGGRFR